MQEIRMKWKTVDDLNRLTVQPVHWWEPFLPFQKGVLTLVLTVWKFYIFEFWEIYRLWPTFQLQLWLCFDKNNWNWMMRIGFICYWTTVWTIHIHTFASIQTATMHWQMTARKWRSIRIEYSRFSFTERMQNRRENVRMETCYYVSHEILGQPASMSSTFIR